MPRKRLTREESREQTRLRLMDAAAAMIVKKGLGGTSVEDIAAHAGYTRGAFYSNFKSKTELFVELLRRDHAQIKQDLQALLDADLPNADLQKQLPQFYGQSYRDHDCYLLWAEARLHAARDTRFRQRLQALHLETRDTIAYFITQFCKRMGTALPAPAPDLATALMALIDGMICFNVSMPGTIPDANAETVLGVIFSATFFNSQAA